MEQSVPYKDASIWTVIITTIAVIFGWIIGRAVNEATLRLEIKMLKEENARLAAEVARDVEKLTNKLQTLQKDEATNSSDVAVINSRLDAIQNTLSQIAETLRGKVDK